MITKEPLLYLTCVCVFLCAPSLSLPSPSLTFTSLPLLLSHLLLFPARSHVSPSLVLISALSLPPCSSHCFISLSLPVSPLSLTRSPAPYPRHSFPSFLPHSAGHVAMFAAEACGLGGRKRRAGHISSWEGNKYTCMS